MDRTRVVVAGWILANHQAWDLLEPRPRHDDARLSEQNDDEYYEIDMRLALVDGADDDAAYRDGGFGAVPAASEAIAALREMSIGEAVRERECTVCMEGFVAGDKLRAMPCSHCFHERCIFDWLRASGICPLCRHRLPNERQP